MKAAILCIGTELTRGEITNTNATWLAQRLTELDIEVIEERMVADDEKMMLRAMQELAARADIVLCSGGLGPTGDDKTAAIAAQAIAAPLENHPDGLEVLKRWANKRKAELTPPQLKQALLPKACTVLDNVCGSAPGFLIHLGQSQLAFMPGVPREMKAMFDGALLPLLPKSTTEASAQKRCRVYGLGESSLETILASLEQEFDISLGFRVCFPMVELKFLARRPNLAEAEKAAQAAYEEARSRIGEVIYSAENRDIADVLNDELRANQLSLGFDDAVSRGALAQLFQRANYGESSVSGIVRREGESAPTQEQLLSRAWVQHDDKKATIGLALAMKAAPTEENSALLGEVQIAVILPESFSRGDAPQELCGSFFVRWSGEEARTVAASSCFDVLLRLLRGQTMPLYLEQEDHSDS